MHVVSHEHIGMDGNPGRGGCDPQQLSVMEPILVITENSATVHSALDDMHGNTRNFQAGGAW